MKNLPTLTVIVHTKNAESTLESCLDSVRDLANELIVMDMESTDKTVEIAKQFTAKILQHPDVGYADPARNQALAAASGDWILVVDADEEVPPTLKDRIRSVLADPPGDAFAIPRKNLIFGQWAQAGWWPDRQIRLFRRGVVNWPPELHGKPQVEGTLIEFPAEEAAAFLHHNYADIDAFVDRAQRYSSIAAKEISDSKRQPAQHLVEAFFEELLKRYYVMGAQHEGRYGLTLATLQGFFEVLALAKYWEQQGFPQRDSLPSLSAILDRLADDAFYWEMHTRWQNSHGLVKLYWRLRMKLRI